MTGVLTDNLKTYNYIHSQELAMKFRFRWFDPLLPTMTVPVKQTCSIQYP